MRCGKQASGRGGVTDILLQAGRWPARRRHDGAGGAIEHVAGVLGEMGTIGQLHHAVRWQHVDWAAALQVHDAGAMGPLASAGPGRQRDPVPSAKARAAMTMARRVGRRAVVQAAQLAIQVHRKPLPGQASDAPTCAFVQLARWSAARDD